MATTYNNTLISNGEMFLTLITAPFVAFFNMLIAIGAASPKMAALEKLSEMSDEELEAMGMTRIDAIGRILGTHI